MDSFRVTEFIGAMSELDFLSFSGYIDYSFCSALSMMWFGSVCNKPVELLEVLVAVEEILQCLLQGRFGHRKPRLGSIDCIGACK